MSEKSVRLIRQGDILDRGEGSSQEVVRSVDVVVNLSNGETVTFASGETVVIIPKEDLSEIAGQVSELDDDSEA